MILLCYLLAAYGYGWLSVVVIFKKYKDIHSIRIYFVSSPIWFIPVIVLTILSLIIGLTVSTYFYFVEITYAFYDFFDKRILRNEQIKLERIQRK